jgi:chemotaxis protein MotB
MSSSKGGKKGHEDEHEEHVNHEAWVIPYADVLTLLMALFLVLFALGRTDDSELEVAADSFRKELSGPDFLNFGSSDGGAGPLATGGISVIEGLGPLPGRADALDPQTNDDPNQVSPAPIDLIDAPDDIEGMDEVPSPTFDPLDDVDNQLGDPLEEVEQAVRESAEGTGLIDEVGFRRDVRGLIVTIVTDRVLFEPGGADIQAAGMPILGVVADALQDLPNDVMIEGHTDRRPISTIRFPSNWELSTARATSVLRFLVEAENFPSRRISAAGYADTRPIDTGNTVEALAKNRRVEIVVLSTASDTSP